MRKEAREVFLGVRFLVTLYFFLLSFNMEAAQKSTLIFTMAIYFSFSLLVYLRFEKLGFVNRVLDLVFIPVMILLSENFQALYSIMPVTVMHASRSMTWGILYSATGVLLSLYTFYGNTLWMFSSSILMLSASLSAMVPELINTIKKERDSIKKLRNSYRKLLQDFARWERDRRELEALKFLTETATSSGDVFSFLQRVKEKFKVKKIHVIPKENIESFKVMKDKDKGLMSVPVRLDEGDAVIIFEMESPFQLNDEVTVRSLERAGRMVSLYIAGFEDNSSAGRAINIG